MSFPQIQVTTFQIKKEIYGVGFLCILGMTLPIKLKTICVFLMVPDKFSQLNYSQKAWKNV